MKKPSLHRWIIFYSISIFFAFLSSCSLNPTPTKKPVFTFTPSITNTISPVSSPTLPPATLAVVSTMDAIVTKKPELQDLYRYYQECVYMPYACVSPGLGLSPNGLWAVFFTGDGIQIVSVDGSIEWGVTFSELSSTQGAGIVSVAHWSKDGKYLYVFPRQDGADGGYEWFWGWQGTKLIRLDLELGTWTDTNMGYAFSFSPDDQYLAYRSDEGIHIHELDTAQEKVIPVRYAEFGRFTWSPDSQNILFVATLYETDIENRENGFSYLLLNVTTNEIQVVLENNLDFMYPVQWNEKNRVIVEKLFDGFGERYNLEVDTGVITPIQNP